MDAKIIISILGVIIGGFTLIFGVNSLFFVSDQINQEEFDQFLNILETNIIQLRSSYNEVKLLELNVPKGITKICFADLNSLNIEMLDDELAKDTLRTKSANILIYSDKMIEKTLLIDRINVKNDYLCINTNRPQITLSLSGIKNDSILIEE